ncbi:uncharacterized protein LOC130808576 [Amaranthus tricolor]|uniref:uncharacterized protein LOC130808576 n=1 Tax=Amaranthus tricolor TaxID=29722 RepID=UPI00258FA60D|nr:uncharacterized protein LOC130808576 [Amaranthus tricolor]
MVSDAGLIVCFVYINLFCLIYQELLSFILFLSSSHMEPVPANQPTILHTHISKPATDPTQDPSSVYYLHPSDSASVKLVLVVFDGTCISDWKRSMIISLDAKNKMSFVDGSLPQPPDGSLDEGAWKRCNNMVIGWLISSLERHIAKSIMYFKTANAVWNDLECRYGNPSSSQIYRLQEQLLNTSQESNMSVAEYFTKVKSLWNEIGDLKPLLLCTCNPTTNFIKIQ